MSRHFALTLTVALLVASTPAFSQLQTVFQDDLESGAGFWYTINSAMAIDLTRNVSPVGGTKSLYADLTFDRVYHNLNQELNGVRATWYVYDSSMQRAFGEIRAHTGAGYGGAVEQVLAAGKYNNVDMPGEVFKATKYQGRVLYPSASMGWFNLDAPGSPNRSAGWHKFTIERTSDSMARFYVDDVLSRTISGTTFKTVDSVFLGLGTSSSSNGDAWYDGIRIESMSNVLSLNVATPLYVRPGQPVTVRLDVSDLAQPVNGCQALIGYSSTYFPAAGNVAAGGGGVWEELIYEVWNVGAGELDTAIGVRLGTAPGGGTQTNGTVAFINLTAGSTEGTTKVSFRADGADGYATMFSDLSAQPVMPLKRDSQTVMIDGTPPVAPTVSVAPSTWTNAASVTVSFSATDALSGVDHFELKVDSGAYATVTTPHTLNVSALADGVHVVTVKAVDRAGNEATTSRNIYLDKTKPVIAIASAKQFAVELIPSGIAVQGVVNIQVTASDATSGVNGHPSVTVTPNGGTAAAATYVNESPSGTFNYTWTVTAATPNGTATINASVSDNATNSQVATAATFIVNKNQVGGTLTFDSLSGGAYSVTRDVVLVVTNSSGTVLKTSTQALSFVNNTGTQIASAAFTLTDVPAAAAGLSAKTAWTLREKKSLSFDGNGQATVSFTGTDKLRGGDLDASNMVNILDYSILKAGWNSVNAGADINGDGQVQLLDYSILKLYWFQIGDSQ